MKNEPHKCKYNIECEICGFKRCEICLPFHNKIKHSLELAEIAVDEAWEKNW